MIWRSASRQEEIRQDSVRQSLLEETIIVGTIARTLAGVRTGTDASDQIIEDLVTLRERFQVSPEMLAKALIAHEDILGTDEGLNANLGGGETARKLVSV